MIKGIITLLKSSPKIMNSNMVYERIWKELREKMRKINEGNKIVLPEFIQQMLEINGVTEVRGEN